MIIVALVVGIVELCHYEGRRGDAGDYEQDFTGAKSGSSFRSSKPSATKIQPVMFRSDWSVLD